MRKNWIKPRNFGGFSAVKILLDTHSLAWFLTSSSKLSNKARETIISADIIFLPTIVLLEAYHVSKKLRFESGSNLFLSKLPTPAFQVIPLDLTTVDSYINLEGDLEIHDRIIVSSARLSNLPIVTKDRKISKIYPKVIW